MPSDFKIRPARVDDVPIILQLIRDLATYERAPDEVVATEEELIEVLFGERPVAEVLLAFEGESPVGFAVYFYNFSTWLARPGLYLEDLFVKPEKRGKGYGRALLVELAKIARDRGCGRMEWAVLDWNEPAIKFYRALGATPMHEWTVFRLTREEIAKLASEQLAETVEVNVRSSAFTRVQGASLCSPPEGGTPNVCARSQVDGHSQMRARLRLRAGAQTKWRTQLQKSRITVSSVTPKHVRW